MPNGHPPVLDVLQVLGDKPFCRNRFGSKPAGSSHSFWDWLAR
eukprot:CAMPEP_0198313036 /NCGR_PEP_ID=MMETSP1450-20131203/4194_1 /TAXON_ID=753684 ORGANISM="Madagascaria erythrocladiodes, Strain CCMP3234" /NCGR_SAMPLE_ID=MMETSP1450 /ASSEMBLY_ACC=CAM_ASM_001115 /LENGTH=42 /DNA_ID= /DNA_START= /DNA_END= /DNA_ORIENTATION=